MTKPENIQLKPLKQKDSPSVIKNSPVLFKILQSSTENATPNKKCNSPIIIIGVKQIEDSEGQSKMVFV